MHRVRGANAYFNHFFPKLRDSGDARPRNGEHPTHGAVLAGKHQRVHRAPRDLRPRGPTGRQLQPPDDFALLLSPRDLGQSWNSNYSSYFIVDALSYVR